MSPAASVEACMVSISCRIAARYWRMVACDQMPFRLRNHSTTSVTVARGRSVISVNCRYRLRYAATVPKDRETSRCVASMLTDFPPSQGAFELIVGSTPLVTRLKAGKLQEPPSGARGPALPALTPQPGSLFSGLVVVKSAKNAQTFDYLGRGRIKISNCLSRAANGLDLHPAIVCSLI